MSALRLIRPLGRSLRCQPSEQLLGRNVNVSRVLCAFITSKANMGAYQRPAPFPYKEKKYNYWHQYFDRTVDRFDENTKVLVVDGPIGAGKTTFAKQLAADLDMLYVPEADFDMFYLNAYGADLRSLNSKLSPNAQFVDVKEFYRNPKHVNSGVMQVQMQEIRFDQYIDALAHLLNTGQGVVLDRSIYSDFVFMEAMYESGYMTKQIKAYYEEQYKSMKIMLKQPHLVIYLDVPVSIVQKRIKERNRDWEVNSSVLTEKYLGAIDRVYKEKFLKEMSLKSEVLVYDWSNFGDVEVVVEDIERLDMSESPYEKRFEDWKVQKDREFAYMRWEYTNNKEALKDQAEPGYLFPEMMFTSDEASQVLALMKGLPGGKYTEGYDPRAGDSVLFKLK
ncbi:NADH dehydrogenase [ubiquinone] 1 alpha subcomplex subunit 10, mitochondrial [Thrips palmi]|uniref:NADH dehydrogenase [ubiquinone] 1 alpha subcomplex subunit 10, mitochondrial n=1 Tax=Thrips palmi TaxID=161013 RepID=A0A6P8YQN6_THRPL|nr:NADH dehydrogenase [ubiquinone] 1 alpha subcomplex subunit 10, mitochondrial [Thrips palmi]XP_034239267.1 NADH dehydrogenase [ubiquinone] 1 alpha subcomplex subunit 10, mitochondrial [Thrips palmi]